MHTRLLITLLTMALGACSKQTPAPLSERTAPTELAALPRQTLSLTPVADEVQLDGVIEALNQATVSAQTSGRVLELPVDVGDWVKKGDLILRLTSVEQKARAAVAQAQFAEAQAQYTRMQDMLSKKLIAQADFDKAAAAFKSAQARRQEADEGAANTALYAPYSGIVVSRHIKVGETVAPGTPLLTGLSLEQLRVQVDVPQRHIAALRQYRTARLLLAEGKSLTSQDLRIPPSADANSHSFKVLVNLPSSDLGLAPGTLVKIAFTLGQSQQLQVPTAAIAQRGELAGVYLITAEGLDLRWVRLGSPSTAGKVSVLAGLTPGDTIALDPVAAAAVYKRLHGDAAAQVGGAP
ncbi:MAG: efflux RND transporter periplasmic adaptor subunit [Marinagarivorans sp.]